VKHFLRALWRAFLGFVVFAVLTVIIQHAYYDFVPAKWFLNYYYVQAGNATIGEPVPLTVCRSRHYGDIHFAATRTYFLLMNASGSRRSPVKQEPFEVNITKGNSNCTTIQLKPSQQPQVAGTYVIHTEGQFYVHGYRKTLVWETKPYVISDTPASIEKLIKELQQEINSLQLRLPPTSPSRQTVSSGPLSVSVAQPAATIDQGATSAPTASPAPQQPINPQTPAPTGLVGQTLAPILNVLQQTINGLGL